MVFSVLIIDGYIDEPSCLGVPPYLAPLPRYIYGAVKGAKTVHEVTYKTIDQIRPWFKKEVSHSNNEYQEENPPKSEETFDQWNIIIFISGVSVPGKYLGGYPLRYSELKRLIQKIHASLTVFCGPSAAFGIGEEGGKPSIPVGKFQDWFDYVLRGDGEEAIAKLLERPHDLIKRITQKSMFHEKMGTIWQSTEDDPSYEDLCQLSRKNINDVDKFTLHAAEIIAHHPNFNSVNGGNLICEIETFKGCPRFRSGGCAFCIEPQKGPTQHREITSILEEIGYLYDSGARHFRLGNQTDFYAFQHGNYDSPKYPRPNPEAIYTLLSGIRNLCPEIKTLHIDNVNVLNFSIYPKEAKEITKHIVHYCTAGNIAAIGIESVDPVVIKANNLKGSKEEILEAIMVINQLGSQRGTNGSPVFLPGLNFIMGLPKETQESLQMTYNFLKSLLDMDLLVRRINLRKFMIPDRVSFEEKRAISKHLNKNTSVYFHWKKKIREEIDIVMIKRVFPLGTILKRVYAETNEGNGTLMRQAGTYPITCFVPKKVDLFAFYDLIIVNHGSRSLECLLFPLDFNSLSEKELESIDGIGKKRAIKIRSLQPQSNEKWIQIFPEIGFVLSKLLIR